jgi:hypothetical protein
MNKPIKWLIAVPIIIVLTFACGLGAYLLLFRDEPAVNDADLTLSPSFAPVENNGYLLLNQRGGELQKDDAMITGLSDQDPLDRVKAKEVISKDRDELAAFYKAVDLPYFGPADQKQIYRLSNSVLLTKLAEIDGRIALDEGRTEDALKTGVAIVKLGYKYEHCHGKLIDSYLGMSIKGRGLDLVEETLKKVETPKVQWVKDSLLKYRDSRQGYIEALKIEYTEAGRYLDTPVDSMLKEQESNYSMRSAALMNLLYKRNKTKNLYAKYFRGVIDYEQGTIPEVPKPWDDRPSIWSGNYMGESLLSIMVPRLVTRRPQALERRIDKILSELGKSRGTLKSI